MHVIATCMHTTQPQDVEGCQNNMCEMFVVNMDTHEVQL